MTGEVGTWGDSLNPPWSSVTLLRGPVVVASPVDNGRVFSFPVSVPGDDAGVSPAVPG